MFLIISRQTDISLLSRRQYRKSSSSVPMYSKDHCGYFRSLAYFLVLVICSSDNCFPEACRTINSSSSVDASGVGDLSFSGTLSLSMSTGVAPGGHASVGAEGPSPDFFKASPPVSSAEA